jgi:hypothetical protein
MEHVPEDQVDAVLRNILAASSKVYFQISTVADQFGAMIGGHLHLSVNPAVWWHTKFYDLGFGVEWMEFDTNSVRLIATR